MLVEFKFEEGDMVETKLGDFQGIITMRAVNEGVKIYRVTKRGKYFKSFMRQDWYTEDDLRKAGKGE